MELLRCIEADTSVQGIFSCFELIAILQFALIAS